MQLLSTISRGCIVNSGRHGLAGGSTMVPSDLSETRNTKKQQGAGSDIRARLPKKIVHLNNSRGKAQTDKNKTLNKLTKDRGIRATIRAKTDKTNTQQ